MKSKIKTRISMFDGCTLLKEDFIEDDEAVIRYLTEDLAGTVGEEYEDPYGQERIVAVEEPAEEAR